MTPGVDLSARPPLSSLSPLSLFSLSLSLPLSSSLSPLSLSLSPLSPSLWLFLFHTDE